MEDETLESNGASDGEMSFPKWFALQTLSNQEGKVKAAIQILIKEHGLVDVIHEVLVPSEKVVEVRNGKKLVRVRKFYPGYVFVKMRMYDTNGEVLQEPVSLIRGINGVVRFVGDRDPVELKQREIDDILEKVEAVSGKSVPKVLYDVGETVKINDGPFLNLTGTVEAIDTDQGHLRVNVSMFGRLTPVNLEFWQVRRFVAGED
ncbi:MAG: transcription termination/antitermination protein NusG [Puniceicoccales bacterium]|jgi:transcriptional antiterminator NusG|nr:transcription termination/antitermination protein NusG [Puniceicoccales bacterium]